MPHGAAPTIRFRPETITPVRSCPPQNGGALSGCAPVTQSRILLGRAVCLGRYCVGDRKGPGAMVTAERTSVRLACAECGTEYPTAVPRYRCDCGSLLTVEQPLAALRGIVSRELFDGRLASRARLDQSGVWRFRELLGDYDPARILSKPEVRVKLYGDPYL